MRFLSGNTSFPNTTGGTDMIYVSDIIVYDYLEPQ